MLRPLAARILILILVVGTVPLVGQTVEASPAKKVAPATERVEKFLTERRDELGFAGVSAAWVGRDGRCEAVAVGLADRETKRKITTKDRLLSGSIGKTYVATVALQLVVEKKLSLDAKVSEYIGEKKWFERLPNAADLTIRSLMNHTSGIPRYVFDKKFLGIVALAPDRVWKPEELLGFVFNADAHFAVGKGWSYADTNYIVLGVVIETITSKKFYDELQRRVLDKFGLKDTVPSNRRKIPGLIPGYTETGGMFGIGDKTLKDGVFVINPQFEWCGGGLACTTSDLARWAMIFGEAAHWPADLRKQVFAGVKARLGPGTRYGLGVIMRSSKHGSVVGHSGFMPGYLSEMRYYEKLGVAVAIQFNTDHRREIGMGLGRYLDSIVDILVPRDGANSQDGKRLAPIRKQGH